MSLTLDTNIQYLKGIGEKRSKNYHKLNIVTVRDLLYHFPRAYIDLSQPYEIFSAPLQEIVPIRGLLTFKSGEQRIRKGLSIFKLKVKDATGMLEITMFNSQYVVNKLQVDQEYIFYGKLEGTFFKRTMTSPSIYPINFEKPILSIYPQTAGITSQMIRNNLTQALEELPPMTDMIPQESRIFYNIGELNASMEQIHFPQSIVAGEFARNRFIFQELLTLVCALHSLRAETDTHTITPLKAVSLDPFYENLPYTPTQAQYRCIAEATNDMEQNVPMNRLIQGDVGSGKTLVAAACMYFVAQNTKQVALMVPTEILAEQHFHTLTHLLSPFQIKIALLTGSTKTGDRKKILHGLEDGSIDLCVGTHALLSEQVVYHALGLVITDEQHRFGVAQRATLAQKSDHVHVLIMSATPIPRTLSLIVYGDLSLSLLDEMPPGRKPVETLLINSSKLQRAFGFIRKNLDLGQQAYIVCPLIEMGEIDTGLKPAQEYSQQLAQGPFKGYSVGLLHGKMKPKEKEAIMREFKAGEIQLLVSTTVVEVGVDVPNATIMMIENAERFGLSQLHQLRGRVGRGSDKSYCILVSDSRSETALQRLQAMKQIQDGFQLAEYDLKLRGPGDFFGSRQHGLPELKIADLANNANIMEQAQECATTILKKDPDLSKKEHQELRKEVERMLAQVGDRPN